MTDAAPNPVIPFPVVHHRVFVVDDHPMLRTGLKGLISEQADMEVCGEAATTDEALAKLREIRPDVFVTDLSMPGRGGMELIKDALALMPDLHILVVSMHDEMIYAKHALSAGAKGYLTKDSGVENLAEAIRTVLAGRIYVSGRLSGMLLDNLSSRKPKLPKSPIEKLSRREFEIFRLFGSGLPTCDIAKRLHLSEKTIAAHRVNIKRKLEVTTVPELVSYAVRWTVGDAVGR